MMGSTPCADSASPSQPRSGRSTLLRQRWFCMPSARLSTTVSAPPGPVMWIRCSTVRVMLRPGIDRAAPVTTPARRTSTLRLCMQCSCVSQCCRLHCRSSPECVVLPCLLVSQEGTDGADDTEPLGRLHRVRPPQVRQDRLVLRDMHLLPDDPLDTEGCGKEHDN